MKEVILSSISLLGFLTMLSFLQSCQRQCLPWRVRVLFLFEEKIQRPFPPNNMQAVVFTTQSSTIKPKNKRISRQDKCCYHLRVITKWIYKNNVFMSKHKYYACHWPPFTIEVEETSISSLSCITLLSIKLTISSSLINFKIIKNLYDY